MEIILEKRVAPRTGQPRSEESGRDDSRLGVCVVFTSVESTVAALKHAAVFAERTAGSITLIVPQIVPYPLPLASPPVLIDWNERRFRVIAEASRVETTVRVHLCRDRTETLKQVLDRRSLVVLAGPRRWWRLTAEKRLAGQLRRCGHEVVFIETE